MELTNRSLRIGEGCIDDVASTLWDNGVKGKILYVSDSVVDGLYGDRVKSQIDAVGRIKVEIVDHNTIAYAPIHLPVCSILQNPLLCPKAPTNLQERL